ncbi:MAG: methyl-accepting chemotaxis protein [Spirochaetota bacterium]
MNNLQKWKPFLVRGFPYVTLTISAISTLLFFTLPTSLTTIFLIFFGSILIISSTLSIYFQWQQQNNRSDQEQIKILSSSMSQVGSGNLNIEIDTSKLNRDNLVDNLTFEIKKMLEAQKELLALIKNTSDKLNQFIQQTFAANKSLADKVKSQVVTTDGASTSLEGMSVSVDSIFTSSSSNIRVLSLLTEEINTLYSQIESTRDNTDNALSLSNEVSEMVEEGDVALKEMNQGISNITASSGKITNIVTVIKEISDRVNLLSLNASIEAARAGQYGKGFAVVANEVSKLAEQTASSIKEIEENVKRNNQDIAHSKQRIEKTNEVFRKIVNHIELIVQKTILTSEILNDELDTREALLKQSNLLESKTNAINAAILEQKLAYEEIIQSTAQVTQQSHDIAKETEKIQSSMDEIKNLSEEVQDIVQIFKF